MARSGALILKARINVVYGFASIHFVIKLTPVLRVESNLKDATDNGIDPMNIHLVGHSMGCQLCSFIAKGSSRNSSVKLWLITF